jgi:hypothetical protein
MSDVERIFGAQNLILYRGSCIITKLTSCEQQIKKNQLLSLIRLKYNYTVDKARYKDETIRFS